MTKHLLRKGFEFKELEAAGLSREGRRGPMDRFHRRLLWPIRASGSEVIGFGARRMFDDDQMEAKYVNTPETVLYKKSSVLFGLDLAKRDIAKGHQAVVVEGYTDVMAMHLAGVTTAVASCGTAFGDEHLSMLRRLMMDDNFFRGELIYVFDGDAAGRAAAVKAFDGEQNLAGQSFVAVADDGMDPCDLRLKSGDGALRDLVARRTPLFEFAIRTALAEHDLDNAEGRVAALRRCVPMVARIKDPTLRDEYARQLAGWVGWDDVAQVIGRVREEAQRRGRPSAAARRRREPGASSTAQPRRGRPRPDPAGSDAVAAARGAEVRAAVPGAGRAGVRLADRGELHPSRLRGGPGGHRGGGRHVGGAVGRRVDRGGARADGVGRRPRAWSTSSAWSRSVSRTTRSCRATSAGCWPGCRKWRSAARSPRSSPSCSACRRWSRATSTTRCSATWSRWRPIAAACWNRPAATTLLRERRRSSVMV